MAPVTATTTTTTPAARSYDEYCAKVRRFIPRAPLPGQPVAYWNWTLFRQNNALVNLMGTLAVWAAVAAWLLLR